MTEPHDLQKSFDDLNVTIPPPIRAAEHRAALLRRAETVTASTAVLRQNETVTESADARPLDWSAQAFSTNGFGRHKRMRKRTIIALAAALMLVSTALAQQIIQYFLPDDDDERETTFILEPTFDFTGREEEFRIPPLDELVPTLPFTPLLPTLIPDNYRLEVSHYDEAKGELTVHYGCKGSYATGFAIIQQPATEAELADILEPLNVGASAVIETVLIGGAEGQYVEGGWEFEETIPTYDPNTPSVDVPMSWDNDYPSSILRWHRDGMLFMVHGSRYSRGEADCALDKAEVIAIAESLAPYTPQVQPTDIPRTWGNGSPLKMTPTPVT